MSVVHSWRVRVPHSGAKRPSICSWKNGRREELEEEEDDESLLSSSTVSF